VRRALAPHGCMINLSDRLNHYSVNPSATFTPTGFGSGLMRGVPNAFVSLVTVPRIISVSSMRSKGNLLPLLVAEAARSGATKVNPENPYVNRKLQFKRETEGVGHWKTDFAVLGRVGMQVDEARDDGMVVVPNHQVGKSNDGSDENTGARNWCSCCGIIQWADPRIAASTSGDDATARFGIAVRPESELCSHTSRLQRQRRIYLAFSAGAK